MKAISPPSGSPTKDAFVSVALKFQRWCPFELQISESSLERVCMWYLIPFSCFPAFADQIYAMKLVLHLQIYDEASTIGLRIKPLLIR